MTATVLPLSVAQLPEPLVLPGTDLTDYPYMPLYLERLRRSKAWLRAKRRPELGFYMLNLWAWSWHEIPASSVEDDDDVLADAAMCDPALWDEVRDEVMRGWVKCSDGRLYHPIVAELVHDVIAGKQKASGKGREMAEKRWGKRRGGADAGAPDAGDMLQQCTSMPPALLGDAKGDGEREGDERETSPSGFSDEKPSGSGSARAREAPACADATPLPQDFRVVQEWIEEARRQRVALGLPSANLATQATRFANRYGGKPPPHGLAWRQVWLNWALDAKAAPDRPLAGPIAEAGGGMPETGDRSWEAFWRGFPGAELLAANQAWMLRLTGYRPEQKFWHPDWGPRPEAEGCQAPRAMVAWALEQRPPPGGAVAAGRAEA